MPKHLCTTVIISFFNINNKFGVLTLQGSQLLVKGGETKGIGKAILIVASESA